MTLKTNNSTNHHEENDPSNLLRKLNNLFKQIEPSEKCLHYEEVLALLRKVEAQFSNLYYTDMLTKLPNRIRFEEDLAHNLKISETMQNSFAVCFLDLDRFKYYNDTLGYTIGDQLLNQIANRLLTLNSKSVSLYRFGGDEFTILFKDISSEEEVHVLAKEILKLFKNAFQIEAHKLMITCSVGISIFPTTAFNLNDLVERADTAMHFAKECGKDTYQIYSEEMRTVYSEKLKIETQLRKAIEEEQFHLNYQPQIDLKTKKIIGVEALIRWNNRELGFVPPNKFIPLAEETGLIDCIGDWVLKAACQQLKKWQIERELFIRVGVNISPLQFQNPNFINKLDTILKETGIEAKYVDLEITENGLMKNSQDCITTLQRLKDRGFKISIDDFGTGYSSLSYLKRFPIDTLKIDQSFIKELNENSNDQAIVTSIISLAHNMKLNVIAEGVETVEIVKFLNKHKCDEMQGYLFSKPISSEEFETLLHNIDQYESIINYS